MENKAKLIFGDMPGRDRQERTKEQIQMERKAACFDELLAACLIQEGWNNSEDWAIEQIHEAFCAQEEIKSAHQFAAQYISSTLSRAIASAKKATS